MWGLCLNCNTILRNRATHSVRLGPWGKALVFFKINETYFHHMVQNIRGLVTVVLTVAFSDIYLKKEKVQERIWNQFFSTSFPTRIFSTDTLDYIVVTAWIIAFSLWIIIHLSRDHIFSHLSPKNNGKGSCREREYYTDIWMRTLSCM